MDLDRTGSPVYTHGITMSKVLSLKLRDEVFQEMESIARRLKRPRNAYINEAVAHFNHLQRRRLLGEVLARESAAVMDESMRVLKEFEAIDEVPD